MPDDLKEAVEMLRELEFEANPTWSGGACYFCRGAGKHEDPCALAALLERNA